jgi:hypothetical protein
LKPDSFSIFNFHVPGEFFGLLLHFVSLFPQSQKPGDHWAICSTASFFVSANSFRRLLCDGRMRVALGALILVRVLMWLSWLIWVAGSVLILSFTMFVDFIFCELFPSRVARGHGDNGGRGGFKIVV